MKRRYIIIINILMVGLILFVIVKYANDRALESNRALVASFEKMTITTEQIIDNYLEDEQHLCDIWSNYINNLADAGNPMTMEEAVSYIRKVKISSEISGHLIYIDDGSLLGISTSPSTTNSNNYQVDYSHISIFDNFDIKNVDGKVNLTRAYTNPLNGVQSIAFLNNVKILDEEKGVIRDGLIIRVVPVSRLEQKLIFLKGEYEKVEISIIDWDGNYMIHGKSLKNSNFYEYFKSYNPMSNKEFNKVVESIHTDIASMHIRNSKSEDCVIAYTPLTSLDSWYLIAYIPAKELTDNRSVDWLLLGMTSVGLMILLHFNLLVLRAFNRKLEVAAIAANQANEAKSQFLSTMSHDIRTPMNAIVGMNEMILRNSHDEEILTYANNIKMAGTTLLAIIKDILDFSKIEAGKMELVLESYNFVSLLNDLVNMVTCKAEEKGLFFELNVDRNIPRVLIGDEIRIKQIITNILSNAVKYTKEGGITFTITSTKSDKRQDEVSLHVEIKDTGVGIKKEDLDKLFIAFERIEEKKNRDVEGTGLGMAIAQSFLNMMGSKIYVESEYGVGSVFSFELRQTVVDWEAIGEYDEAFKQFRSEQKEYKAKFEAPEAKILIVDDTEINLKVLISLLRETKIQIDTADSGDACISKFKTKHYDIIFLDHMMPGKDGIETIKEMRTLKDTANENTPVICLTANAVSGMREKYIEAGFDDYLTKPIDTVKLENMILNYLSTDLVVLNNEDKRTESFTAPQNILVINKDLGVLRKIKEWLEDAGNIVLVKSEEQAIKYLENHEVSLILVDKEMRLEESFDDVKLLSRDFKEMDRDELIDLIKEFL
ncbi:response regulator [Lachnospira multipara]|uniref:response regulator n=1 Tax=Lachnospira multipara TaxID=28051 RepID=UPI0012DCA2C0|nr:response regulator [Lachnospira multipara]